MGLFVFIVALLFLIWYIKSGLNDLKGDIRDLEQEVQSLRRKIEFPSSNVEIEKSPTQPSVTSVYLDEDYSPASAAIPAACESEVVYQPEEFADTYDATEEKIKAGYVSEFNLGAKLPVWIGAIALVFAGFYLVKYSIESGWLQPSVRLALCGLMGMVLLGAGQWLAHRPQIANAERMAQGLVGAGLVSLYVCFYAGVNLYDLIGSTTGFIGMIGVTVVAVFMSLKHGQPIAVFGLIGGLLTPAMVASDEPNAIVLFTYLFMLFAGVMFMLSRKGWWMLATLMLAGMFVWSALWFATQFTGEDSLVLVLFAMGLCCVVLLSTGNIVRRRDEALRGSDRAAIHSLNMLAMAGGAATIIWLSFMIELTLFDWSMMGLLTLAVFGLAFFMPKTYGNIVFAKLFADLMLFTLWSGQSVVSFYIAVAVGLVVIYNFIPLLVMRYVRDPRLWAVLQLISALAVYGISYLRLESFRGFETPFEGFWGVTALIVASYSVYMAQYIRDRYVADDAIRNHLFAIYALLATSFLSLGIVIEVPWAHVPLAFAIQGLATMWIFRATRILFLGKIVSGLIIIFLGLNWAHFSLLAAIVGASLLGDAPPPHAIQHIVINNPLLNLGLPALFWGVALYHYIHTADRSGVLANLLTVTVLFLVSMMTYYLIRDWFHADEIFLSVPSGFIERGVITLLLAVFGIGLFHFSQRSPDSHFLKAWAIMIFKVAVFRIIYFDIMLLNPYFDDDQFVGNLPLINGVTMIYGGALLMCLWAVYKADWRVGKTSAQMFYAVLGLCLVFIFVSLTVRQFYHGGTLEMGAMSITEFYIYSVVWLLTGLALLTYGISRDSKPARLGSLVFMLLTIGKVFFFDASELEGLYRVFSFLGLGTSMIGLSFFYSRFVFRKDITVS